jgi:hypothetical protein
MERIPTLKEYGIVCALWASPGLLPLFNSCSLNRLHRGNKQSTLNETLQASNESQKDILFLICWKLVCIIGDLSHGSGCISGMSRSPTPFSSEDHIGTGPSIGKIICTHVDIYQGKR